MAVQIKLVVVVVVVFLAIYRKSWNTNLGKHYRDGIYRNNLNSGDA